MAPKISAGVYLKEHFPSMPLADLAAEVMSRYASLYGTRTHLLCGGNALAVVPTGTATIPGRSPENLAALEKESSVCTFINEFGDLSRILLFRYDAINFWVPRSKYYVGLKLVPRETNGHFLKIRAHRDDKQSSFECRLISKQNGWSDATSTKIECLVRAWAREAALQPGYAEERFESPPEVLWMKNQGVLAVRQIGGANVTFPWVELYLRLRYGLPRRELPEYMSFNNAVTP